MYGKLFKAGVECAICCTIWNLFQSLKYEGMSLKVLFPAKHPRLRCEDDHSRVKRPPRSSSIEGDAMKNGWAFKETSDRIVSETSVKEVGGLARLGLLPWLRRKVEFAAAAPSEAEGAEIEIHPPARDTLPPLPLECRAGDGARRSHARSRNANKSKLKGEWEKYLTPEIHP